MVKGNHQPVVEPMVLGEAVAGWEDRKKKGRGVRRHSIFGRQREKFQQLCRMAHLLFTSEEGLFIPDR